MPFFGFLGFFFPHWIAQSQYKKKVSGILETYLLPELEDTHPGGQSKHSCRLLSPLVLLKVPGGQGMGKAEPGGQ